LQHKIIKGIDLKIVCLGAGKSGFAAAKLAKKNNHDVFLSEFNSIEKFTNILDELNSLEIEYEFGGHSLKKILDSDLVVCSPGIKPTSEIIQEIKNNNIKLISEIEFASYYTNNPIIAVTGTNGKTTTVNLIHYIITSCGKQSELLGNVGNPFSDYAQNPKKDSIISLELSSYQLDNIVDFRPDVAVFLNITEDHLSYHGSFQHYFEAKWKITSKQNENDLLILNVDDKLLMQFLNVGGHKSKASFSAISTNPDIILDERFKDGIYSDGEKIYYFKMQQHGLPVRQQYKEELMQLSNLALPGIHNLYNSMAAAMAVRRFEIKNEDLRDCLATFQGVEHRLEFVRTIGRNDYINDSKATNVNAAWYALSSYERPIIWIAGGQGENDYSELFELAKSKVSKIITFGEEANNIFNYFYKDFDTYLVNNLEQSILKAKELVTSNEIILFSPACKSFDQYTNFEERGQHFKTIVKSL
jgi:UDP-N-acetylmuramoylalanine--D-glutamate ligase